MNLATLAALYRTKTDEELLQLAERPADLTEDARLALSAEMSSRRIEFREEAKPIPVAASPSQPLLPERAPERVQIGSFIEGAVRFYLCNRSHFVTLMFPAVFLTTLAYLVRRQEVYEISRQIEQGADLNPRTWQIFEMAALNFGTVIFGWLVSGFWFAAICVSTEQLVSGLTASVKESIRVVIKNFYSVLALSTLSFLLAILCFGVPTVVSMRILFRFVSPHYGDISSFTVTLTTYAACAVGSLVFLRFSLAMPALVLDDEGTIRSLFRSDELTAGKWPILAVLLLKSVVGGYIAGKLPFWLAGFILSSVHLPSWFGWVLTGVSVVAVTLVEPIMFIGFALLYLKACPVAARVQRASA